LVFSSHSVHFCKHHLFSSYRFVVLIPVDKTVPLSRPDKRPRRKAAILSKCPTFTRPLSRHSGGRSRSRAVLLRVIILSPDTQARAADRPPAKPLDPRRRSGVESIARGDPRRRVLDSLRAPCLLVVLESSRSSGDSHQIGCEVWLYYS